MSVIVYRCATAQNMYWQKGTKLLMLIVLMVVAVNILETLLCVSSLTSAINSVILYTTPSIIIQQSVDSE